MDLVSVSQMQLFSKSAIYPTAKNRMYTKGFIPKYILWKRDGGS